MSDQNNTLNAGLLHNEKVSLSKSILNSMLNSTVQHHNAYKSNNLFPSELAVQISNTNLSGIDSIIKHAHQIMTFEECEDGMVMKISYKKMRHLLSSITEIDAERQLLIEYLKKGAGSVCLYDLFNLNKNQVVRIRKHYNITISSGGRPDIEEAYEAKYQFDKIHTNPSNLKNDLLQISEKFSIPLNTVWLSVRTPSQQKDTKKSTGEFHAR